MTTKIIYLGTFHSPVCTENAYADAFVGLGCDVVRIPQDEAFETGPNLFTERYGRDLADADLLLYTRRHDLTALTADWTDVWRKVEADGIQTASVHLDVFWGLPERENWARNRDPLFTVGTVFTADGGSGRHWDELGINHRWLPPAADLRGVLPFDQIEPDAELARKVVFVGSSRYHRQHPWRPQLIDWLQRTYRDDFAQYGSGAPRGTVRGPDLDRIYRSDCVVVGDHCFSAPGKRVNYWSDRTPETLGRGGLLMQPTTPGMNEWYSEADLVYWDHGDLADLGREIDAERDGSPEDRLDIRMHGRDTVLGRDTYPHRAAALLDTVGLSALRPQ